MSRRKRYTGVSAAEVDELVPPVTPLCNAKMRQQRTTWTGQRCQHEAGWGTSHQGWGRCRKHGGATPTGKRHAALQAAEAEVERTRLAMRFFGRRVDISPEDGMLEEYQRSMGIVRWIEAMLAEWGRGQATRAELEAVDPAPEWTPAEREAFEARRARTDGPEERRAWSDVEESHQLTGMPQLVAVHYTASRIGFTDTEYAAWRKVYLEERAHLAKVAKLCIDGGIQERQQRVMEARAGMMAAVCSAFVRRTGLQMGPEQVREVMQLAIAEVVDSTRDSKIASVL